MYECLCLYVDKNLSLLGDVPIDSEMSVVISQSRDLRFKSKATFGLQVL